MKKIIQIVAIVGTTISSTTTHTEHANHYNIMEEIKYAVALAPRYEKIHRELTEEIDNCKKILAIKPSATVELQLSIAQCAYAIIKKETLFIFNNYHNQLTSITAKSQKNRAEIDTLIKQLEGSFAFLK